jgi:hypothetical protein
MCVFLLVEIHIHAQREPWGAFVERRNQTTEKNIEEAGEGIESYVCCDWENDEAM